jgi:hypothetical protein
LIAAQSEDVPGPYSGPYEAGAVWAVVDGAGILRANDRDITVTEPGCIALVEHGRHTHAVLELEPGPGVIVHATCFTPGLA